MSNDPPSASLSQMLCFDIYGTNLAFGRVYKPLLDPLGLTYPQYLVLVTLWRQDGQSVGQIGAAIGLESSTLTPLIKRLQAAGLVDRHRDGQDERRVLVTLTDAGQDLRKHAPAIHACAVEATGLAPDEARDLQRLLQRLRASLAGMTG